MGRLVRLWKVEETRNAVVYLYGPTREQAGHLSIDKIAGTVAADPVPGMSAQDSWFSYGMLAKAQAEKMFKKGEYPEETSMAT